MKEIGSEYWIDNDNEYCNNSFNNLISIGDSQQLLYSGRTAIDYVLDDIDLPITKVYMPSYCCESMLQPFIDRNISIDFYEVRINNQGINYHIDYEKDVDLFFANSYFGYHSTNMDTIIEEFKKRNVMVIEDITHRLLCKKNYSESADYKIASLRKWFAIPSGGLAAKQNGSFKDISLYRPPSNIITKKITAMTKKAAFINKSSDFDKSEFLNLFSEFNKDLRKNYKRLLIDDCSINILKGIDINYIRQKRRENVRYIYDNLKMHNGINFLVNRMDYFNDCLLFVPLIVEENMREAFKQHLITNLIYSPVHWPIPYNVQSKECDMELYKKEISLVCDQRYNIFDMGRLINTIGEFKYII